MGHLSLRGRLDYMGRERSPTVLMIRFTLSIRVAIESSRNRLYTSSVHMDSVLIFDLNGTRVGTVTPQPPNKLEGPSAISLFGSKLYVLSYAGNRVTQIDL